jgi:hypothetical protein
MALLRRIQGAQGLAVGDMTPDIHKTSHGPHHQRWPSPHNQGVQRKAARRCDLLHIVIPNRIFSL